MKNIFTNLSNLRWKSFKLRALLILSVVGPGIIAGTADNDAGGITTYSVAGASFGYQMLWILLLITFILALTQEMGARLGLVTGKGLAALIRENFSLKITTFVVVVTFMANWANILAEYAGISTVADIYGVPRFIAVPLCGLAIWYIVRKGSFKMVQRVFITSAILFFSYIIAGVLAKPDWHEALKATVVPSFIWNKAYFYTAVALIGTTITAWGQFFVQSYFVDKGVGIDRLKYSRWDVFMGAFWTDFVAFFIVVATAATLYKSGITISDASQAAIALEPFAGAMAKHLFAWGVINASLLGLAVVSITSSYVVTEAFGWEGRIDFKKQSPIFFKIFAFCLFSTALVMLIPKLPLVTILVGSQALNTFVLPIIFIAILSLLNNKKLMGVHKNGFFLNIVSWLSVIFLLAMSFTLVFMTFV
jgi:NRAMP (natural resistance-associated macrophage protein)-like metal ion transporter